MKKRVKKLVLGKETLRRLQDGALERVAGGTGYCESEHFSCRLRETEPTYSSPCD